MTTPTLTPAIIDRYSPEELRDMAATARTVLAGTLVYRGGRPLPPRYYRALDLVRAGLV